MRYQLGHPSGESCLTAVQTRGSFTVIHTNGIHTVNIRFCGCLKQGDSKRPVDKQVQLLEIGWWPATCLDPRSAVTFDVLKQFQLLNLHGSLAALEYYRALHDLTDGDGLTPMDQDSSMKKKSSKKQRCGFADMGGKEAHGDLEDDITPVRLAHLSLETMVNSSIQDRLQQFMNCIRAWRNTKLLKRHGRGHYPNGIEATGPGELLLKCRPCLQPKFNLPANWKTAPPEKL
jgi:hypothetical protein